MASTNDGDNVKDMDLEKEEKEKEEEENTEAKPSSNEDSSVLPSGCSKAWTSKLLIVRRPITRALLAVSGHAARNPKSYVVSIICISIALVAIGVFTNFSVDVDEDTLWTPMGSRSLSHGKWIDDGSGFPTDPRLFSIYVHADSRNVLGQDGLEHLFAALNSVRDLPDYPKVCRQSLNPNFVDEDGDRTCPIITATKFWNDTLETFQEQVQNDNDALLALSADKYPDGTPVDRLSIMGNSQALSNNTLISAQTYIVRILFPPVDDAEAFETDALDAVRALGAKWESEGSIFRAEMFAQRSFSDEFTRAIVNDIPLVPAVFIVMSVFTCFFFFRKDAIFSRSMLGFGAVVSVLLSIMSGYGLMFICGVPFTSMTQILPFIMFGIGLDDAFIISGAYARMDKSKDAVERIHDTMQEVGVSIFVTTIASVVAFGLGCLSSVPAVYWLCLYAFPTIFIDFLFQITFFVALIVIDERRIQDKRRDWIVCSTVKSRVEEEEEPEPKETIIDRFMGWYGEFLMQPSVKAIVIVAFLGLLVGCSYSSSLLEQAFEFTDVLPADSYVADFFYRSEDYSEATGIVPYIYFRNVDQSDEDVQQQMEDYVNSFAAIRQVAQQPSFFWLRDFKGFVADDTSLQTLTFAEQIEQFLNDTVFRDLYSEHIVLDENGNVLESRVSIRMNNVDQEDVNECIEALEDQRSVGANHPENQGKADWSFFAWANQYYIWEFYSVASYEMALTTILGVVSVTIIGTIFIPHWSAVLIVFPFICVLYVDLLGVLQFGGVSINAVSYVALVMSIGLLVDFLLHILLRYFESTEPTREGKVKDTLRTMGSSILVGGISTFLGVIPLAFSTSTIFGTIFITFMGLVTLGIGHGLILIPVVLSLVGTTETISVGGEAREETQPAARDEVKERREEAP